MPSLTPEQVAQLDEMDAGEGKKLTPAQKAVMLKFGTKVTPKDREGAKPKMENSGGSELKATYK